MEDEKIIELYMTRSENAIRETDIKYGRSLRSISFGILGSKEDSEECVNDTYMRTWSSIPPANPPVFFAYIARIARNISVSRFRSLSAEKRGGTQYKLSLDELGECVAGGDSVEGTALSSEVTKSVNRFLLTLSADTRRMFVCRYFFSDSISDISKNFGASEAKVKSALYRAREGLREFLLKEGVDV